MTFEIFYTCIYNSPKFRRDLIEALLYMFPNKKQIIMNNINKFTTIKIINNEIKTEYDGLIPNAICDDTFVKCIDLLKNINDKCLFINVENLNDHTILQKFYKNIKYCYCYYIIINDEPIIIDYMCYNIFFNKYKTISTKTYIRNIKLKQIL